MWGFLPLPFTHPPAVPPPAKIKSGYYLVCQFFCLCHVFTTPSAPPGGLPGLPRLLSYTLALFFFLMGTFLWSYSPPPARPAFAVLPSAPRGGLPSFSFLLYKYIANFIQIYYTLIQNLLGGRGVHFQRFLFATGALYHVLHSPIFRFTSL